ncbi:unnamed protein product [Didymodactylos carnosus]|uniref:Uncharacterized protein n=1 Tax=Didymodactylos carnosus TaxID=1234261 RepID=A0A8S2CZJ6_9BILA|nr:unnamed protein product [Didymodactylos carnosus]CAF3559351.1 unnamed protein product [Didymodactylos carnosus]
MSLSDLGKSSNNDNDSNDDYDNGSARRYSVIVTSANEDVRYVVKISKLVILLQYWPSLDFFVVIPYVLIFQIPPLERSTIPPAATTGANIGIVISTPLHHRTPWKDIIKCVPLYGITIMHVCANFVFYTLLTSLPIYFATILNFDLHENGFLFALPYFCQSVITVCAGNIMERIRKKTKLTTTSIRKIPTIIGCVGLSISLVAIGYFECNRIGAVLCCILAVGFIGFLNVGSAVSYLDLAPNYAGTLVGITNTLGTIPGFVGPLIVGAITNHNQTLHAWKVIFDLTAGIGIFGCVAFCLLFRGEEQKWNHHPDTAEEKTVLQSDLLN